MAHRTCKLLIAFVLLVLVLPAQAQRHGDTITITIPAAAVQGATTGHAYWINVDDDGIGSLLDAGTSIAAANPTNQPPFWLDVARFPGDLSWSVFYGSMTGNVGGKLGIAELWPTQPVEVPGTIPPYVRDVASHWIVTAGLTMPLQGALPAKLLLLYDITSLVNTGLDSLALRAAEYDTILAAHNTSAGAAILSGYAVDEDGGNVLGLFATASAANGSIAWSKGVGGGGGTAPAYIPPFIRLTTNAAGAGNTIRVRAWARTETPRRPSRIAPYIQWVNPGTGGATPVVPTAASPIYIVLRGR